MFERSQKSRNQEKAVIHLKMSPVIIALLFTAAHECAVGSPLHGDEGGATITVCPDGTCDYTNIASALDAASEGDTVSIKAGTYTPACPQDDTNFLLQIDYSTKGVHLIGEVDAENNPLVTIVGCYDQKLTLDLRGPGGQDYSVEGIHFYKGGNVPIQPYIYLNGGCMRISSQCDVTISGCEFDSGTAGNGKGGGIYINNGSSPHITNCDFVDCSAPFRKIPFIDDLSVFYDKHYASGGALWSDNSSPLISQCTFHENEASAAAGAVGFAGDSYQGASQSFLIVDCHLEANKSVSSSGGAMLAVDDAIGSVIRCSFVSNKSANCGGALTISNGCFLTIKECDFDSNWSEGIVNIFLNGVNGGDHLGEEPDVDPSLLTALGGEERGGGAIWCGKRYWHDLSNVWFDQGSSSQMTVEGCKFSNNYTITEGGAIKTKYEGTKATIRDSVFTGNQVRDAAHGAQMKPYGGALYLTDSTQTTIINCDIRNNSSIDRGGGIALHEVNSAVFTNCVIAENDSQTHGGGVYVFNCKPDFIDCSISKNYCKKDGGGFHLTRSKPTLTNCDVERNRADHHGGGFWNASTAKVYLCDADVCGNYPDDINGSYTTSSGCDESNTIGGDCAEYRFTLSPSDDVSSYIDQLLPGEQILLEQGTYHQQIKPQTTIDFYALVGTVDKNNTPLTILAGDSSTTSGEFVIDIVGEPTIRNIIVKNVPAGSDLPIGGGMRITDGTPTISNCRFTENKLSTRGENMIGAGVTIVNSPRVAFTDCLFELNEAPAAGAVGMRQSMAHFTNCMFQGLNKSTQSGAGGITLLDSSVATIADSGIEGNQGVTAGGIFCEAGSSASLDGGRVCGNQPSGSQLVGDITNGSTPIDTECIGVVYTVDPEQADGDETVFARIEDAIALAPTGATINVTPGIYRERLFVDGKRLDIRGVANAEGEPMVTIDAEGLGTVLKATGQKGSSELISLTNIIFQNGSNENAGAAGGLELLNHDVVIENCIIQDCSGDIGGVLVAESNRMSIIGSTIGNNAGIACGGINLRNVRDGTIRSTVIGDNAGATDDGHGGLFIELTDRFFLPIELYHSTICANSPDQIEGPYIFESGDIVETVCRRIVSPDGKTGYSSVQVAIDASYDGDEIFIMPGVYEESIDTQGKKILVQGILIDGGPEPAVVIVAGNPACSILKCQNGETNDTIFRNIVFKGGDCEPGVMIQDSNPLFENCHVTDCTTYGGVHVLYGGAVFRGCTIEDNENRFGPGGGLRIGDAQVFMIDCTVRGNRAVDGTGGGIHAASDIGLQSGLSLLRCVVSENTCDYQSLGSGGISVFGGTILITDCNIERNTKTNGVGPGGVYNAAGFASIVNTTVCGNTPNQIGNTGIWDVYRDVLTMDECPSCPGDVNLDGVVDGADLGLLIAEWGPCPPRPDPCPADFNGDGQVNGGDLGFLLACWGLCP